MMDAQAIKEIERLVDSSHVVEVSGKAYSTKELNPVVAQFEPSAIEVHTLQGFCDYINGELDDFGSLRLAVVVDSPELVGLTTNFHGEKKLRTWLVKCCAADCKAFPFGMWLEPEEFAIRFRSLMEPQDGDDSSYILSTLSRLTARDEIELCDDGVTQVVTVKKGASGALTEKEKAKPIVKLAPYRTFREVQQPLSEFLFRVRSKDGCVQAALFEADGGAWQIKAMELIKSFIQSAVPSGKVLLLA